MTACCSTQLFDGAIAVTFVEVLYYNRFTLIEAISRIQVFRMREPTGVLNPSKSTPQ
jgi:hypothetical protein